MQTTQGRFESILEKISLEIPFNPEWINGTGYYDGIVKAELGLKEGERAKTTCTVSQRRIVIIGTAFGNVAIFERFTPNGDSAFVLVSNVSRELSPLIRSGSMDFDDFIRFAGHDSMNIGRTVADLKKAFATLGK